MVWVAVILQTIESTDNMLEVYSQSVITNWRCVWASPPSTRSDFPHSTPVDRGANDCFIGSRFFDLSNWFYLMVAFALAVFFLIITPGPGVLSIGGVGAAFGWRQGTSYLGGLFIGNNLICFAVVSGLATVMLANPVIRTALLITSATYLGYLALRIAFAGAKIAFVETSKPGVVTGIAL